jgi:hypothetical protein
MAALLDVVRDFLLVAALAWVGVTVEPKPAPDAARGERTAQSTCAQTSLLAESGRTACSGRSVMFSSTPSCAADK